MECEVEIALPLAGENRSAATAGGSVNQVRRAIPVQPYTSSGGH